MNKDNVVERYSNIESTLPSRVDAICEVCKNNSGWVVYKKDITITDYKLWCKKCGFIYQAKRWNSDDTSVFYNTLYVGQYYNFERTHRYLLEEEDVPQEQLFYNWSLGRKGQIYACEKIIKNANTVLDLGCGSGGTLHHLTKINRNSIGTDLSKKSLEFAKRKGLNVKSIDITKPKQKFDVIFCSNFIEHLPTPNEFIRGIENSLERKGKFIVIVPSSDNKPERPHVPHVYNFTNKSLIQFIEEKSNLRFVGKRVNKGDTFKSEFIAVFSLNGKSKTYPEFKTSKVEYQNYMRKFTPVLFKKYRKYLYSSTNKEEYRQLCSLYNELPREYKKWTDLLIWSKLHRMIKFKKFSK